MKWDLLRGGCPPCFPLMLPILQFVSRKQSFRTDAGFLLKEPAY